MKYNGYDVEIIRKNNKNTYIKVSDDMKIIVTANYLVSKWSIRQLLEENNDYINKMIDKKGKKLQYEAKFFFLGKEYDLQDNSTTEDIDKWYKKQASKIFKERLDIIYNTFEEKIPFPRLTVRKMKTRWGVCNRKLQRVTLNLELVKKDYKYIDYVIVHELAHFIYFDHSREFWALVGKYAPGYKKMRKELNNYEC